MYNLRLGAVYGPDRRPCPLWPLVVFPEDVDRKIAELLAPQPRLPTPQYYNQIKHHFNRPYCWRSPRSQWSDAVSRFIDNYWDSGLLAAYRLLYPRNPSMVFVDWDDKGRATIDLSRALDSDNEADDSDDDSDDDSIIELADDSDDDSIIELIAEDVP